MDEYLDEFVTNMLDNLEYRNGIFEAGWTGVHTALLFVFSLPLIALMG